jgi:hypothetical protein
MGNVVNIPNVNFNELIQIEQNQTTKKEFKSTSTFDAKNYLDTRLKKGEKKKELKIRLLPNPSEQGFSPFIKVHTHNLSKLPKEISESGFKNYICLEKSNIDHEKYGKKCPFCELQREAYNESTKVMTEAENKAKEVEKEYTQFLITGNKTEATKREVKMREIRVAAEAKKKSLQELSLSNIARESVIMRVIERGKEDEGVKFWKVNVSRRGDDAYSLIKNLAERLYKEGQENGVEENIYDSFKGRDITVTISGSDNEKDNKTSISVTPALAQSPISRDEETMRAWIYDEKKWNDVFAVKPYEYLSIVSKGEIPWFDRESGKWVSKEIVDSKREEHNKAVDAEVETQMSEAEAAVSGMFMADGDEDLPF